jgi:hypothetical protein
MVYLVCVESGGNHIGIIIRRVSGMSMMAQLFFFVFPVQQPLGRGLSKSERSENSMLY